MLANFPLRLFRCYIRKGKKSKRFYKLNKKFLIFLMTTQARIKAHEFVNTTLKEYGIKATLDALQKETNILKHWSKTESMRENCKYPKLAEVVSVTKQKQDWDDHDNGTISVEAEFTPNVTFSAVATCGSDSSYELHAVIRFNGEDHQVFDNDDKTVDAILKMYKFLNLTDVPVGAFISLAIDLLGDASDNVSNLSQKQSDSCISSTETIKSESSKRNLDSETSNESGDEPPSKKQKVEN